MTEERLAKALKICYYNKKSAKRDAMVKKDKTEALYANYIKDVIARNQKAIDYQKRRQDYWQDKPYEEVVSALQKIIEEDNQYHKDDDSEKTPKNDLETLIKIAQVDILFHNYKDNKRVAETIESYQNSLKNADKEKCKSLRQAFIMKMGIIYKQVVPEQEQEKLKADYLKRVLSKREAEKNMRESIKEDFKGIELDGTRDHGNCTKGIMISLYKLQKKYDIPLFDKNLDKEQIVHPKELSKELEKYVKKSESGLLKDIKGIKEGDIIMLTRGATGAPGHAMMCYEFNEKGEPLLMGFSDNTKEINAYTSRDGGMRNGFVIDIKSFIRDRYNAKEKSNLKQEIRPQKQSTR